MIGRLLAAALLAASFAPLGAPRAADAPGVPTRTVDDATIERLRRLHYTESAEVRLMLVPASVTDRRGRVVTDLDRADFRLYDDRQLQQIRFFASESRDPVSVAFLLDVSGSMRQLDKLEHAKHAIRTFVDRLRPGDRFALIAFADGQVAWITEFTEDRARFLLRLEVQEGYGQTALHDAVAATPSLVDAGADGRKAIVLITDGVDNASRIGIDAAIETARRVSVPIYTIGFLSVEPELLPKGTVEANVEVLGRFAEETGGRMFVVADPDELKEAVERVDAELRHQYLIGYYPAAARFDGRFHEIRVESPKRSLVVRARRGYVGTP